MSKIIKAQPLPHSWLVCEWPTHVAPNSQPSATHLVRQHRKELIACGALARIGRNLIVYGQGYGLFLSRMTDRVEGYQIAPNRIKAVKITPKPITGTATKSATRIGAGTKGTRTAAGARAMR